MSLSSQALRRFGPAFQQGVRGPFWDFSLLILHPSDTLPVILSWDCFTFPRDVPGTHRPSRRQAAGPMIGRDMRQCLAL